MLKKTAVVIVAGSLLCLAAQPAAAVQLTLSDADVQSALDFGRRLGAAASGKLEQQYGFGERGLYSESGVIRTPWHKLALLSGLLSAAKKTLTEREIRLILDSVHLQIDVCTFGDRIEFAKDFKVQMKQNNETLEPEKVSIGQSAYHPGHHNALPGFPPFRATISAYFPYAGLAPDQKAEIILLRDGRRISFEIDFAAYR